MKCEFRYAVEDFHGEDEEDYSTLRTLYSYDLDNEFDCKSIVKLCAEHYWYKNGGYESTSWANGERPLAISIWRVDRSEKKTYSVYVEVIPEFRVV